jgi:hypothetical protein
MRIFTLLKLYPTDRRHIKNKVDVGDLFELLNTPEKIILLDREEIIDTLRSMSIEYRRKGYKIMERQTQSVLKKIIRNSHKVAGKGSLIHNCMVLFSPPMNTIVRGAFDKYQMWKERHENRRIIIYGDQ